MKKATVIRNADNTIAFVEIGTPPKGTSFRVTNETWDGNVRTINAYETI